MPTEGESPISVPVSEAREQLAELLNQAAYTGQITYITKRGQRVGAIVPVEVAEAAEEAEDAYLSRLAAEAEADLAAGAGTRPLGQVLAELGLVPELPEQREDSGADVGNAGQRPST